MNDEPLKNRVLNMIFPGNYLSYAGTGIVTLTVLYLCFGINDAGERTVVQYPTGTLIVKFTPGVYFKGFGSTHAYWDVYT